MALLVDTSVRSLAYRRDAPPDSPHVEALRQSLRSGGVVTTGVVLLEMLRGFVPPPAQATIRSEFAVLEFIEPARDDYDDAAALANTCRTSSSRPNTSTCAYGAPTDRSPAAGHNGPVAIDMTRERFETLVDQALDDIPDELASLISNVVVLVEDEPPEDDPDLLGLYDGVALTERDGGYAGQLPDRILIFRNPLLEMCESEEELVDEVRITVVHEVAHHFGIDDDRLHALGYA